MNREDVKELHYITPITTVQSIMRRGILSNTLAKQIEHESVAMPEIQDIRENKQIPGARRLHEYANLYFDAHNPMLSKRRPMNDELCVLRIDPAVLDLAGVILTDRNAATDLVGFWPLDAGLQRISSERVFARFWLHRDDLLEERRHKAEKCAEVLVPDRVDTRFIIGAYVASQTALAHFQALGIPLPVRIQSDMFFW